MITERCSVHHSGGTRSQVVASQQHALVQGGIGYVKATYAKGCRTAA